MKRNLVSQENTAWALSCPVHGAVEPQKVTWACPTCSATLRPIYDVDDFNPRDSLANRPYSLYRFRELLPVRETPKIGTYVGWTPLVPAPRLGKALGLNRLYLKLDSYNWPSYSYKDRVVSSALQRATELGHDTVACVSTGNVGNSLAALAAAAGMRAVIFYPAGIEAGKNVMSLVHDATVIQLDGTFDDVNAMCRSLALEGDLPFVNLNLRPYYAEGAKTIAYEIVEQLGWVQPDHVVAPAAGAALLTRMAFGFAEAKSLNMAEGTVPRIHAAQASGCAPIANAFRAGTETIERCVPDTLAKSIAIGNPADGPVALRLIRESGGSACAATDPEILQGIDLLAATEGIFTEPAGGTAVAVTRQLAESGKIGRDDVCVVAITGSGLKTQDLYSDVHQRVIRTEVSMDKVKRILDQEL
ncbi:threonine synthase [Streptomyces griseoviridis]|uniref:threonine synthase n=1 Tax=Streptomyces TaxID=1883 RepID=UPI0024730A28|nr:threonine synthase [Streptomyces sp. MAA16]MDH6703289.1 threonine synthase [Streptomyces sp. MAA16]